MLCLRLDHVGGWRAAVRLAHCAEDMRLAGARLACNQCERRLPNENGYLDARGQQRRLFAAALCLE